MPDVNPLKLTSELPFSQKNVRFCIFKMANIRNGLCVLPLIEADGNKRLKGFTSFWHLLLTLAQKEIVEGKQQPVDDTRTKESSRVKCSFEVYECV